VIPLKIIVQRWGPDVLVSINEDKSAATLDGSMFINGEIWKAIETALKASPELEVTVIEIAEPSTAE